MVTILFVLMPNAIMLYLTNDSRLALKVMLVANTLAYSAMMKYGHHSLCLNA